MTYQEIIEHSLQEAKAAREELFKVEGVVVGKFLNLDYGLYLSNYSNLLLNRQIDIFDDSMLLLNNNRFQAACIISRGMIETHAFSRLLNKKVEKILLNQSGSESLDKALEIILKFTNSSRFKKNEQERIKKGVFDPSDYMFTEETKYRFENFLSVSQHVADALKELYADEKEQTKGKESGFELIYDALSEHVHPSQTSISQYYTPENHLVPTSMGDIHAYDAARLQCAKALHFIIDAKNQLSWSSMLADEMTKRSREYFK